MNYSKFLDFDFDFICKIMIPAYRIDSLPSVYHKPYSARNWHQIIYEEFISEDFKKDFDKNYHSLYRIIENVDKEDEYDGLKRNALINTWLENQPKTNLTWKELARGANVEYLSLGFIDSIRSYYINRQDIFNLVLPIEDQLSTSIFTSLIQALKEIFNNDEVFLDLFPPQEGIKVKTLDDFSKEFLNDMRPLSYHDKFYSKKEKWQIQMLEESEFALIGSNDLDIIGELRKSGLELQVFHS